MAEFKTIPSIRLPGITEASAFGVVGCAGFERPHAVSIRDIDRPTDASVAHRMSTYFASAVARCARLFPLVLRLVRLAAVDRYKGSRPIPDARPYRIRIL